MAKDKVCVFVPGEHGSTYGGNPLACAAAYATLKYVLDHNLVSNAGKVGQYLLDGLEKLKQKYEVVIDVRGRGLLVAIEFNQDIGASLLAACLERGLLVNRVKPNALRLMPPLTIGNDEVDEALGILDKALSSIA